MLASDSSSRSTARGRVPVMIPSCRLHQISLFVSSLETSKQRRTLESRGIHKIDTETAGPSVKRGKKISHRSNKGEFQEGMKQRKIRFVSFSKFSSSFSRNNRRDDRHEIDLYFSFRWFWNMPFQRHYLHATITHVRKFMCTTGRREIFSKESEGSNRVDYSCKNLWWYYGGTKTSKLERVYRTRDVSHSANSNNLGN